MKKSLFIISAAAVLLAGCAKEQLVEQKAQNGPVNVVSATFEDLVGDDATKAAVADDGTFTWQNGDKAAFAGESAYLQAQNSSTTATASFSYSGTLASSTYGIFPYDLTTDQNVNTDKVKVPTYREWAEGQTNVAMYATYASNNFSFEHLGGLVKVTINNIPTTANKFVFKTKGWKINGVFDITTDSESKKVISTEPTTTDSEMEYTLTFTAPSSEGTSKVFYIPLPVGTYNKGFAVYLKNDDQILSQFEGSTSQKVTRKSFFIMPAINLVSGSIEDAYKDALVETIPAGYSGDYLLPKTDKLVLKIKASSEDHDITLKYNGENKPTKLEIKVFDGDTENAGNFNAKLLGDLPYTHVDFTYGHIDHTSLTTSSSTLAVINPATVGTLTVTGGNVVLKGATVNMIEVAKNAVADASSNAPVEIKMEKYTPEGGSVQTPVVTGSVVAEANVKVAPVESQIVTVVKVGSVTVQDTGLGTVEEKDNEVSASTFDEFKNAITTVVAGQTIKVTENISNASGISVAEGKNFTVDFGGHTYTGLDNPAGSTGTENQVFQLLQNSTITFKNGTIDLATTNQNKFRFLIQNYANLTLEDIILDGTNLAITDRDRYTISNNCGTVEFKGNTTIKAATQRGIAFDVCKYGSYTAPTVTWNSEGSVNGSIELTGGKFVVAKNLAVSTPVMAASGESTLEVGINASLSSTESFYDPNPNLSNHNSTAPVQVKQGAGLTVCGDGTIDGVKKAYSAVIVSINGDDDSKPAKLTVCGNITLQGDYYGIVGNGNRHNTDITVNGGTVKGIHANDNIGIYHPQAGKLTISGGSIEGYSSAVEVRGGTVNITGGNLSCTASPLDVDPNGSGSTTKGAALAIAQHTTKKDINVTVNGGTLEGYKAIAIKDAQNNGTTNVNVTYKSGTLNGGITLGHGTFTLGGNLAVKEPVKVIGKTTLDLADYTLSAASGFTRLTAGVIIVNRLGDLTVKGNTNGAIDAKQVYAAVLMTEKTVDTQDTTNPAKLTVESGSLLGLNYGVVGNGSTGRGNTVITVTGGKIKGTSTESAGIYHPQNGTLTIAGGEIEGSTGIYVKSGDVITSVSAGTIKGTGAKNDYEPCTNGFQSTGDAIVFDNCGYPGGEPNAKIFGGTFISTNAAQIGNYGYLPTYQPITIDYTGYQGTKPTERTNIE